MTHDELARYVAQIVAPHWTPLELAMLVGVLMDVRALQDWAEDLRRDPHASPPAGAFGVAKRG